MVVLVYVWRRGARVSRDAPRLVSGSYPSRSGLPRRTRRRVLRARDALLGTAQCYLERRYPSRHKLVAPGGWGAGAASMLSSAQSDSTRVLRSLRTPCQAVAVAPEELALASVLQAASKRRSRQIGPAIGPDVLVPHRCTRRSAHRCTSRSAHRCGSTRASRRAACVPREASFAAH